MDLCFPRTELQIEEQDGQAVVWDIIRRQWMVLQPEEWVRQQLLHHLIRDRKVSKNRIGVEKKVRYRGLRKRFDMVVFDEHGKPLILIECKAPEVALSQETILQIARYNREIQAPHLLLTNGVSLLFFSVDENGKFQFQKEGWFE
jgi:type I site-specific restriction endonuclease